MNILENKFKRLKPGYLHQFKDFIELHAQKGGGSESDKYIQAKSFSNVYELYMYSFFVGLYKNERYDLTDEDKLSGFWEVENWRPLELVESLLTCAIAESDFDMIAIEDGDDEFISKQVRLVKREIEAYANGGLRYIKSDFDDDPELMEDDTYFLKLLSN